ncbi:MAG: thiamine pyrophosphate-binding protein [Candidatus Rokubacteria bacterium]|nr:thiamine pyrophosphate-binding protein [Candidatus Rokubacteria bacterium]MBI3826509.1 thiamine pyrophosphate-binding protein [Candidatus Rokubacteria bacterium]
MPFTSGKQAFLEILRQEGVSVMFGNPGTTELPLMDGLAREPGIRYVLALQEAAAIAMTDAYAQASGGLGAVNVHVSPGLGNAMGMLYDAQKSGAPMLLTAGQHDQSFTTTEPILWSDLPPIARPFVKWSTEARRLEDLPRIVRRATKTAMAYPTGPVFLSLPVDVLNAERDIDLGAATRIARRMVGDRAAVQEAAALLARAERPLIVAGDCVAHGDAIAELIELAELIGCPVRSEGVASTCSFPFTHPQCAGGMPRVAPGIRALLMRHDLLFSVGGDLFTLSLPSDVEPMPHDVTIVHLDVDPWELGKNYAARVAIQGDPKATLPELSEAVRRLTGKSGHAQAAQRRDAVRAAGEQMRQDLVDRAARGAREVPMSPLALVHALASATPEEATIVDESISSAPGVRDLFRCRDAKSFFGLRGGGIGWGLPAAVGVKLALPQRPVVALIGDGSAMYTCQALWTAAHERLAIVYVIFNNASYRILKERTLALKGFSAEDDRYVGMDLERPHIDFVGLAKSLGVGGERVEKAGDVAAALGRGLASGAPYLLDVRIDPAFK